MTPFGFATRLQVLGYLAICAAVFAAGCKGSPTTPPSGKPASGPTDEQPGPAAGAAVTDTRAAVARQQSQSNLKQIALALHNYHDTHNQFPFPAVGKGGFPLSVTGFKPLFSWRVGLLPFLEQDALFKQFKLDEPWDSEHNKKLIPLMPKVYAAPGSKAEPGYTHYQIFTGRNALDVGARLASIPDGTSNTFGPVEAAEPVIWTKPADMAYDPKKPLPKLGGLYEGGFNAALLDGQVIFVRDAVDENLLRAAIDPQDGIRMPPKWYEGVK
jgi:Protein of unknown function (DUF1559)